MNRKRSQHVRNGISTLASAPAGGVPLIEITGNTRILIENHRGVISYSFDEICIKVCSGIIEIVGDKMQIQCMSKERIIISGSIDSVRMLRRSSREL